MSSNSAVSVKNVIKTYGSKVILDELSMNVERGKIYGLLGASGCGKTTLLSCIVGRKNIDAGDVLVFGGRPGEKGSGVPGPKIGYMPQELALCEEFTVKDAIYYFGTIFKMKPADIKRTFEELTLLLDLPNANKLLKHCSGGQQRRVSLAAALVHSPKLLILDEPTAGVDPILREKIWAYLQEVVEKKDMTVIITTHYIEETKNAHKIGLMRKGKLLIEESPKTLLTSYQKETLEQVFLLLSQRQEEQTLAKINNSLNPEDGKTPVGHISTATSVESFVPGYGSRDDLVKSSKERKAKKEQTVYMSATEVKMYRIKALIKKNWKQFYRNIGGILFFLTFPVLQMLFFTNSLGADPRKLNLGIVNNESMSTLCTYFNWNETTFYEDQECHFRNLTCRFLTYLEHPMINKVKYDSLAKATEDIKHGIIIGVLYMPSNFSESFEERVRLGAKADDYLVEYGEIKAYMDMSNRVTGAALATELFRLFVDFQKKLYADCNIPEKFAGVPMQENFMYGEDGKPMTIFSTPGMILLLVYLLGSTMTCQIIVKEKLDGVWDRSIVAGVSSLEITLSHLFIQSIIMIVECAEVILMTNLIPELKFVGSIWLLFLITYLQGFCGMAFGFLVSSFCETESQANIYCTGLYVPLTVSSGVIWPIEAMPTILKWMAFANPCTLSIVAFRNVMSKGWDLFDPQVISGVGVLLGWTIIFGIGSVWLIKIKR